MTLGDPAMIRQQSGRAALIRQVREEVEWALRPAPTQPYGAPGWPLRKRPEGKVEPLPITDEAVAEWVAAHPFVRSAHKPGVARALAFLDTFRHPRA